MNNKKIKWFAISEYVDIHTGELISKSLYEREYIKLKTTKKYETNGNHGTIKYLTECEKNRQTRLF